MFLSIQCITVCCLVVWSMFLKVFLLLQFFVTRILVVAFKMNSIWEKLNFHSYHNLLMIYNLSAVVVVVVNDEVHDISLNFTHHPMRGGGDRLQILKNEAESMKRKLVDNLVKNINDQNQAGTLFEYASVFVLRRKIDLEERCALLVNLAEMYCKDYTHSVVAGEDDDAFWVEYNISVKYPAKISGSVDEILSEFKNLYPTCNRKWGEYSKDLKEGNFRFWKHILSFY